MRSAASRSAWFALLLGGCIPLAQTRVEPPQKHFAAHIDERRFLAVAFQAPSPRAAEALRLDTTRSYVVSPGGRRYTVDIRYNTYANAVPSFCKQGSVFTTTPQRMAPWSNGEWTVHFAFLPSQSLAAVDARVKIWTFFYNPTVHGPPN